MKSRFSPVRRAELAIVAVLAFATSLAIAQPTPPQIVLQPVSVAKRAGASVIFSVQANGSSPLAYQWRKDGIALVDDGHFSGTHSNVLGISPVTASDAGAYSVAISNSAGLTNSAAAILTVQPWQPWNVIGSAPNTDEVTRRVVVAGDFAYLANGYAYFFPTVNTGLRIVNVADPASPYRMSGCRTNYAEADSVFVTGNRAYVALATSPPLGLGVVDISNPAAPSFLGLYDTTAAVAHGWDVAVSGSIAFVALGSSVQMFDVSNPANIARLGWWSTNYGIGRIVLSGTKLYAAGSGFHVLDVTDPAHPVRLGGVYPANICSVAVSGNYAFTVGGNELRVYDVSNPSNVTWRTDITLNNGLDLKVDGDLAFVARGSNGVAMVDVSDPLSPTIVGAAPTLGAALSLFVVGDLLFVADGPAGLTILARPPATNSPPSIISPPLSQTVTVGSPAFFSVAANGTAPLRYQWLFENVPLPDATNSILWLTNVQPERAGNYFAVVTNDYGSATSGVAVLNVSVPPRLDIRWSNRLPRLKLTGTVGYDYAIEHAPQIPCGGTWFNLTNFTLTSNTWQGADASASSDPMRYYRARQLEFAPDSLAGKTIVATITNPGPFTVTLAYSFSTFTQTNGPDVAYGNYSYTRTGPVTAWIYDQMTAPPDVVGDTSRSQLIFTSATNGTFVNNAFTPGEPVETSIGVFQIINPP